MESKESHSLCRKVSINNKDDLQRKFCAFISYSHKDERWASWMHRSLERYAMPSRPVGAEAAFGHIPKRIYPVFLDNEKLASVASLSQKVQDALSHSRNLIVIC